MNQTLIFAKKILLSSKAANVVQSINMALGFSAAGSNLQFYPGSPGKKQVNQLLHNFSIDPAKAAQWHIIPTIHKGLYGLLFRCAMLGNILKHNNACFYTRDIQEAMSLIRMAHLLKRKIHLIFEMHEVLYLQHQQQHKHNWQQTKQNECKLMHHINGLVVINESLIGAARKEFGYIGPALVEPSGVNLDLFPPVPLFTQEHPWPTENEHVQLIYIGSLQQGKGVHELVKAMALLPENFSLRIIGYGAGEALQEFQALCQKVPHGATRITYTGFVPQSQIHTLCADAHIAVIPQQVENAFFSPLKLYESLALGLPVVCTPLSTFAQQQDLLFFAENKTPEALAKAVRHIAQNAALATALRQEGLTAAADMSWTKRATRILSFAQSLTPHEVF